MCIFYITILYILTFNDVSANGEHVFFPFRDIVKLKSFI